MIARIWRGWTRTADAAAYAAYIAETGLAEYSGTPGNRGAYLLHHVVGDRAEFIALSLWDDLDSIAAFAGEDVGRAVFYAKDEQYLLRKEARVTHYVVTEPHRHLGSHAPPPVAQAVTTPNRTSGHELRTREEE